MNISSKPFGNVQLLARINAVLRRTRISRPIDIAEPRTGFSFDEWVLDFSTRSLQSVTGAKTRLPAGEFNLLAALCERPNCVLSRTQLVDALYKKGDLFANRNLDVYVYR
ncbi:MAG: winged helix-turn-helix domain-containing protein, partial [Pseudomonadota bacterium]|nr:winged helix-turn-helix domain-containing protein [Pseudomonadota bacterium]